jgi:hypothetical protein
MRQSIMAKWLVITWSEPQPWSGGRVFNIGHSRTYCQPSSINVMIITSRLNKSDADFWGCAFNLWFANYRPIHIHCISHFIVIELKFEIVLLCHNFSSYNGYVLHCSTDKRIFMNAIYLISEMLRHASFTSSIHINNLRFILKEIFPFPSWSSCLPPSC